jgi:hypothetical protein
MDKKSQLHSKLEGINTHGPDCPKCQKVLPYSFACKLFNPYNFGCPNCGARLRSKYITLEIFVDTAITLAICEIVHWFYVKTFTWNTIELVIVIGGIFPASIWASHFYFWKMDKLISKDPV